MKVQSPPHRMIQLRRKTEKIVIPKMCWDLSNKQNNSNITNLFDTSKSKNGSSKKNSVDKKPVIKKTLSMTQNALKCTLKKVSRNENGYKEKKQVSIQKREKKKNSNKKQAKSFMMSHNSHQQNLEMEMRSIMKKAENKQPIESLKQAYCRCITQPNYRTENERSIIFTMAQHIIYWVQRCQSLQNIIGMIEEKTPKMQVLEEMSHYEQEGKQTSEWTDSQPSMCSYIVDPKQQIKMKPIRKQLQQLLHLNFEKVDYLRKKQL